MCVCTCVLVWPCLFVVCEGGTAESDDTAIEFVALNIVTPIWASQSDCSMRMEVILSREMTWSECMTTKSAIDEAIDSGQTEADSHTNSRSSGRTSKTLIWKHIFITALQAHKSFSLDQLEFSIFISYLLLVLSSFEEARISRRRVSHNSHVKKYLITKIKYQLLQSSLQQLL